MCNVEISDVVLTRYLDNQIKKDEMAGTCRTCNGEEKIRTGFWFERIKKRENLLDPGIDGSISLYWML
jgi:hypothetical protein